jgi:hypothetical protein
MRMRHRQYRNEAEIRFFGERLRWCRGLWGICWQTLENFEHDNPPPVMWKGSAQPADWWWVSPAKGWYKRSANRAMRRANRSTLNKMTYLIDDEWQDFWRVGSEYFTSWDLS